MDLDLSADQVALRDGIAALLEGRFGMDRVRGRLRPGDVRRSSPTPGVFSLRADGFSWADCTIVFEQLGRFCVPGSARRVAPVRQAAGSRASSTSPTTGSTNTVGRAPRRARRPRRGLSRCDPRTSTRRRSVAEPSTWPLDPLTPVARVARAARRATAIDADVARAAAPRARCSPPRSSSASPIGAPSWRSTYAKERVQFDRPIAAFQAIKHLLRRHARAHRGRARGGVRGGRAPRRARRAGHRSRDLRRQGAGGRGRDREREDRDAGVRRHGLHLGGRRAPLPEARVGARHALRLGRRARDAVRALPQAAAGSARVPDATVSSLWRDRRPRCSRRSRSASRPIPTGRTSTSPSPTAAASSTRRARWIGESTRLAHALAALGVGHGDRVATLLDNRAEQVVSLLRGVEARRDPGADQHRVQGRVPAPPARRLRCEGVRRAGRLRVARRRDRRRRDDARCSRTASSSIRPTRSSTPCPTIRWARRAGARQRRRRSTASHVRPSDLACFIYTAGTTGP